MYSVYCLNDDEIGYVPATSRSFDTYESAIAYAKTVAPSRKPVVIPDSVLKNYYDAGVRYVANLHRALG